MPAVRSSGGNNESHQESGLIFGEMDTRMTLKAAAIVHYP
jgi:hypothetical protein